MGILDAFDIVGTFVFAISGAFRAIKHELDLLGLLVLATVTGVGGGILRDVLLGTTPPMAFQNEYYLLVCIAGGVVAYAFPARIAARWRAVIVVDSLGLGVFAAIGAGKAAAAGLEPIGILMLATLTATGGGVIRDVLVREVPSILKSEFYASSALIGGGVFQLLYWLGLGEGVVIFATVSVTMLVRLLTLRLNIEWPHTKSLPDCPSNLAQKHTPQHQAHSDEEDSDKQ